MFSVATGYSVTLFSFLLLDFVWLGIMGPRLYRPNMGAMVLEQFSAPPAVVFYLLYGVGMFVFATEPAIAAGRVDTALWRGFLFGLVAYGTYDLTNQATLKGWPPIVTIVDMGWGAVASGIACAAGYYAVSVLFK